MRRVAADFGPIPEYAGESLDRVAKLTEADYPLDGKDSIAGFISLNHEVGSVFPMVIRSEFCKGSIETTTIWKTHPTAIKVSNSDSEPLYFQPHC